MKQFDFTAELTALLTRINNEYYNYNKQLSNIDMELSDILHEIQNTNFSASKGYELAMKVKKLRLKRHQLRAEHNVAQQLYNKLKDKKITAQSISSLESNMRAQYISYLKSEYKPRILKGDDTNVRSEVIPNK